VTWLDVEATRFDIKVTPRDLEATHGEFETQLTVIEARNKHRGKGNARTGTVVK
jgi:hypothetical protein